MDDSTLLTEIEVDPALAAVAPQSLYEALQGLRDGRSKRGRRYEAAVVVIQLLWAKLAGERSLSGIAEWVRLRHATLRQRLPEVGAQAPCANTYRYVCEKLDLAQLNEVVARCLLGVPADEEAQMLVAAATQGAVHLAVDGKRLCGTQRRGVQAQPAQEAVALYDVTRRLMVRQVAVAAAGQERAAAHAVLHDLDLAGCVVSADALHTQAAWCKQILAAGGDYLLVAKRNQPALHHAIRELFSEAPVPWLPEQALTQVGKGHGRHTVRHLRVSQQLGTYLAPTWPHVAQVFQLQRTVTRHGHTTHETVVGLTSLPPRAAPPPRLLQLLRAHWHLENRVHWRRDVSLGEDACQVASAPAAQLLAALNNIVLALIDRCGAPNMASQMRRFAAHPERALDLLLTPP